MVTTNHSTLRMSGALNIERLTALKLHIGVNAHGWAIVEGEAGENALEQLSGALAGREQHILTMDESGGEKCLFAGVIREAELVRVGGYNRFHVELLSGTCLMDREIRSRSFQDVGRTYSQVAEQVCSEYGGGAAICTVGEDKTLERPVIQYRETDWEFLMRMASHCGGVLVPETHRGLPRLWFGFPDRSFTCQFPEDAYTSGISRRYYELGGSEAGYSKTDFFYYDVESPQLCDLGWYTVFKGEPFLIAEKSAILERGELIFTYRLGRPGLGWGKPLYNEKISGMTLLGEVLETSRETLKLKLDIDAGWDPGGPYPYTWRPETGNFMYCMPQVGTRVSLYCPNYDEKKAIAVNCVRTNGGDCERMGDPAKRSFVTEHGKEMNLYPEEMSLVGSAMDNIWGKILVSDNEGVSFHSPKPIYVTAKEDVVMESPALHGQAVNGELLTAVCDVEAGTVHASVTQSNVYDLSSAATNAEGSNCVAYEPYDDAPEESSFNVGALVGNVLAGIAVAAVVGLFVAVSILFFPVLIAAATGTAIATGTLMAAGAIGGITAVAGAAAAIGTGIEDIKSGEVRDTSVYLQNSYNVAATTGAILQTAYGLYNLAQFARQLPNILHNLGKFFSSLGNPGSGGLMPALSGAGANGGTVIISGTAEAVEILTGAQTIELLQGIGVSGLGALMFSKSGGSHGGGGMKGNFEKVGDRYLKDKKIDAHALKRDFLSKKTPIAQYDIYVNKDTGELFIFLKGGKGEGIPTGEFIK